MIKSEYTCIIKNTYSCKIFLLFSAAVLVLFILLTNLNAQSSDDNDFQFSHITTEDGLSLNSVTKIIQDRRGFLWFGTYNGLNRYDGYNFKVFLPEQSNPNSISNHAIISLYEDSKGSIWAGTLDGLNRYDWKTEKFYKYKNNPTDPHSLSNNNIYSIFEDRGGNIWVGTLNGLNKYNRDKDNFIVIKKVASVLNPDSLNSVICIEEDYKGNLWLGTWNGLTCMQKNGNIIKHFFSESLNSKSFDYRKIITILEDDLHKLWIGTNRKGLKKYDPATENFKDYPSVFDKLNTVSHEYITDIFQDKSKNIWVGTKNGLNKYDKQKDEFIRILHNPQKPLSIINNEIYSIIEDNTGLMWIGTAGGVCMFNKPMNKFRYFQEDKNNLEKGLSSNRVNSVYIDKKDNIWVGTFEGLDKIDRTSSKITHYKHLPGNKNSLSNNYITSVKEDHLGYLWIGTQDDGLNRYNPSTGEFKLYNYDITDTQSISNKGINAICEDHNGNMWFGTWWGLNKFNRESEKFFRYMANPSNQNCLVKDLIWVIYEDSQGIIWVGTDGGGVSKLNPITNIFTTFTRDTTNPHHISENRVFTIFESSDGLMWFGTSDGLNSYDRKTDKICIYNKKNGLAGNLISSIQEDDNGYLWIGTDKGLSKFDKKNKTFINFTKRNGIKELEFNLNVAAKSKDGILYFGCKNGLMYFDPESIKNETLDVPVVFTDLKIYNQSLSINNNSILKESIQSVKSITVPPGNDVITIDFALLDFYDAKRNTFQYKLAGFDADWNDVGTRNSATYTNLPPGEYNFLVRATNNNGIKNIKEATLQINIIPYFYQTLWFKILTIFGLFFITFIYFQFRTRAMKKQNRILENKVAVRTIDLDKTIKELNTEIASKDKFFSIIAHDLRSPFTGFIGLSEYMVSELNELSKDDLQVIADNMLKSAKTTYGLLENLLQWAGIRTGRILFQPENINLIVSIEDSLNLFKDNAANKGICLQFNFEDNAFVFADLNMVKTILRNLISNAIKFTEKDGSVEVFVKDEGNYIKTTVSDSGVGISQVRIESLFRLDRNNTTLGTEDEKGSGLGLILCKEFIELNKGQISVNSIVGKGTEFSFTLPKNKNVN